MYTFTMSKQRSGNNMEIPKSFLGYKRENGRAGTRNHVIILPVDDISNACAEAVANNIKGTIALQDLKEGDTILKYGHDIGKVVKSIKKGEHVHVHNVKTKKW